MATSLIVALGAGSASALSYGHPALAPRRHTPSPSMSLLAPQATELFSAYEQLLRAYPLPTKACTQALIWGLGDLAAQLREGGRPIDYGRTGRFSLTALGAGVLWTTYYDFSDALVSPLPGGAIAHTAASLALEQLIWCPLVFSTYQIPAAVLANGGTLSEVPAAVRGRVVELLIANAKLWTTANLVIYNTPLEWRVLASNLVDLVWGYIMADFAQKCDADADSRQDEDGVCVAVTEVPPSPTLRAPALLRISPIARLARQRSGTAWRRLVKATE